jgi:deoxyadenosine/deoxycytidine kinase
MLIVFVEGNVGVGKSSALEALERANQAVVYEAVNRWSLWESRNLDPHRYSFSFQVQVCMSMFDQIRLAIRNHKDDHDILYCERSISSSIVFAKAAHAQGHMVDAELELLVKLSDHLHTTLCAGHRYMSVLLQCPVNITVDRIRTRGRLGEDAINTDMIADLQKRFENYCETAAVVNTGIDNADHVAKAIIMKTQLSRLQRTHSPSLLV